MITFKVCDPGSKHPYLCNAYLGTLRTFFLSGLFYPATENTDSLLSLLKGKKLNPQDTQNPKERKGTLKNH